MDANVTPKEVLTEDGVVVPPAIPVTVTLLIFSVMVWFESVPPAEAVSDMTVVEPGLNEPRANGQESEEIACSIAL